MQSQADAPGSMILMGEYAVLEGAAAVLMTLRHRLRLKVSAGEGLEIFSDRFGAYAGGPKLPHAVLCANVLSAFPGGGCRIDIESDIPPTFGFGSSAALAAALVKALFRFHGREESFTPMFEAGHAAILKTYGRGSGADLAASLADYPFVLFDPLRKTAAPFSLPFTVQAVYTGYKTPTPAVLERVRGSVPPAQWRDIVARMKDIAADFAARPSLAAVRAYQAQMTALGVTCDSCAAALEAFAARGVAAKISGSGLGDCVVGFSESAVCVQDLPRPLEFLSAQDLRA